MILYGVYDSTDNLAGATDNHLPVDRTSGNTGLQTGNSLELRPLWENDGYAATKEFSKIVWNPKVHHHVHKNHSPNPIPSRINQVHTSQFCLRSISIFSSNLRLGLPSGISPSGFRTKVL
jgi:hypothetical protein